MRWTVIWFSNIYVITSGRLSEHSCVARSSILPLRFNLFYMWYFVGGVIEDIEPVQFDSRLLHKTTFGWALGSSRHIINTQLINPPGPVLVSTHGKATKSFFLLRNYGAVRTLELYVPCCVELIHYINEDYVRLLLKAQLNYSSYVCPNKIWYAQYMSPDMRFQQCGMCDQQSLRSACAYAQSDQSLC